jgi:ABC-type Fe3+-hydroxamate transport system substrate-binding protein
LDFWLYREQNAQMFPPERIVCLTEETVETLYLLGEEHRIIGISGYVVRPVRARREKPRVSAFTSADIPKNSDLKPDLVLTFSDGKRFQNISSWVYYWTPSWNLE